MLATLALLLTDCSSSRVGASATLRFRTFDTQGRALSNVQLTFRGAIRTSNENGLADFDGRAGDLGQWETIKLRYGQYGLDTVMQLQLQRVNDLLLPVQTTSFAHAAPQLTARRQAVESLRQQLESLQSTTSQLESELDRYRADHGATALDSYRDILDRRREELLQVKQQAGQLLERYENVLRHTQPDQLVDIGAHEAAYRQLKQSYDQYLQRYNNTEFAIEQNLAARPAMSARVDIFFDSGRYQISSVDRGQYAQLRAFIDKIQHFRQQTYKDYPAGNLTLQLTAVGYTDGEPVGVGLQAEIAPLCQSDGFAYTDPNGCLSYLRAREIMHYLSRQLQALSPQTTVDGRGSSEAGADREPNPTLRRCHLSFALYPNNL